MLFNPGFFKWWEECIYTAKQKKNNCHKHPKITLVGNIKFIYKTDIQESVKIRYRHCIEHFIMLDNKC